MKMVESIAPPEAMNHPEEMAAILMAHFPQFAPYLIFILFILVSVISGTVLLIMKRRQFVFLPGEIQIPKGKRFRVILLNLGMLLFCLFWIIQIVIQLFL